MIRLSKLGVKTLLTADDNRDSYYLDESESTYIADHDRYEDEYFIFVSTDLRLDSLFRVALYPTLVHIALNEQQNSILAVFTHEWLMDEIMYAKVEDVCRFSKKFNYRFVHEIS